MSRRLVTLPAALLAVLAPAASAGAATLATDQPCYLEGGPVTLTGTGFTPGGRANISGAGISLAGPVQTDGGFLVRAAAPKPTLTGPGFTTFQVGATDATSGATASAGLRVANFAVTTTQGVSAPIAKRTWSFSGWIERPGKPLYGHFRFKGRTKATYRFGPARGACGTLKKRAPLIPLRNPAAGKWSVQIDQSRTYNPKSTPRFRATTTVFSVPR